MKTNIALLSLLLILACSGCTRESDSRPTKTKNTGSADATTVETPKAVTPDLPTDLTGRPFDLADYKGQVVILDVWATWCGPCRRVMPHLQEIHTEYGDKGVNVVAVATDQQGAAIVRPYIEKNGFTFRVVPDPHRVVTKKFGRIDSIPTTFIIAPDGTVFRRFTGSHPKADYVEAALAALAS